MQWNSSYQESISQLRQQHQHARGRLAHVGLPLGADAHAEQVRARARALLKEKDDNLSGEDVREGLTAVISAKLPDPQFEGQTKTKLGNPGMEGFVAVGRQPEARRVLRGEPDRGRAIVRKAVQAAQARDGGAQGARPHAAQERAGELDAAGQARRLLGPRPVADASCSSSRATPRAARPSRAATATRRRCCRCAARSSTSRSRGSTRSCRTHEIQALITAIGTGVREEFNLENARYHKIILMTDADVDGAHIRTLALTLLFREMQELIEAGYVYIAKPPLYKLKQGRNERYIESETSSRRSCCRTSGTTSRSSIATPSSSSSPRRAGRVLAPAQAVRGLGERAARRVRPRHRHVPRGVGAARREGRDRRRGARAGLAQGHGGRALLDRAARRGRRDGCASAPSRRKTGLARTITCARPCSRTPSTGSSSASTRSSSSSPARRRSTSRSATPRGGAVVRVTARRSLTVAQKGVSLQRFKGLGEMNADQLRETTMDPASRTLQQVTMDDAAAADRLFSMLMGDQVEPRRAFIEDNARAVANLDV